MATKKKATAKGQSRVWIQRVHLNLGNNGKAILDRLSDRPEYESSSHVVRVALQLLDMVVHEEGTLTLKRKGKPEVELRLVLGG